MDEDSTVAPRDYRHREKSHPLVLTAQMAVLSSLVGVLVLLTLHRRLNFDELLALRSGFLFWTDAQAAPAFAMPWTALLGLVGHAIEDPGTVFALIRLLTVLIVCGSTLWAFWVMTRDLRLVVLGFVMLLLQGAFVSHGLEARYDSAILVGLVVSAGALVSQERWRGVVLGAAVAWLAIHHMKGLVMALAVLVVLVLSIAAQLLEQRHVS